MINKGFCLSNTELKLVCVLKKRKNDKQVREKVFFELNLIIKLSN